MLNRNVALAAVSCVACAWAQESSRSLPSLSATIEDTYTRKLADGNVVSKTVTGKFFRDAAGRTRLESGNLVVLRDPAERTVVVLDLQSRVARRLVADATPQQAGAAAPAGAASPANPGALTELAETPLGGGEFSKSAWQVPAGAPKDLPPPPSSEVIGSLKSPGTRSPVDLGVQTISGVEAEGKRLSTVIPPGTVGNLGPITHVSEVWFSQRLGVPVLSKSSDPLNGDHIRQYSDVVTGASLDPALFEIGADFRVEEGHLPAAIPTGTPILRR